MVAQTLLACGFIPIIFRAPFPVVVVCFFPIGLGEAIYLAMGNTFAVNLQNGTNMLGAMHGSYGLGATMYVEIYPSRKLLHDTGEPVCQEPSSLSSSINSFVSE